MKLMFALFFLGIANVFGEEYTNQFNSEVDVVLKSERLLKNYLDCLLDRGKCTPAGQELKKDIPDALLNECAKCNDEHKEGIRKVIHYLIKQKPDWWQQLQKKYDPDGEHEKKYKHYLEKEGLTR
ncbi:unnamed protein product [Tenebrio molitor]|nr:unnamed protein product [Tenebrio molitor]